VNSPRAGAARKRPNGSTRFCSGIGDPRGGRTDDSSRPVQTALGLTPPDRAIFTLRQPPRRETRASIGQAGHIDMLRAASIFLALALFSPTPEAFAQAPFANGAGGMPRPPGGPGMPPPGAPMPNSGRGLPLAPPATVGPASYAAPPAAPTPLRLPPQLTAAPIPASAASADPAKPPAATRPGWRDPRQTAQDFRSRCGAAKGAVVGAASHGFCVFN
jgi:hypothetical protein